MSQSPVDSAPADDAQLATYRAGWQRLVQRISAGESFSGRERHCFFLNLGAAPAGKRFADLSFLSGIDFPEDGRGIATVDWDRDGDLDLWISNRTSPAVRFLENTMGGDNRYLQLDLEGTACNRDAIGARVEVMLAGVDSAPLIQTVRAGETYLSQSSKTLHFGLGTAAEIASVTVRWPGSREPQAVTGLAANRRYRITQGKADAERIEVAPAALAAGPEPDALHDASPRLVATTRPLFPPVGMTGDDGTAGPVIAPGQATVVNVWASWCQACVDELAEWTAHADDFRAAGLAVVLANADSLDGEQGATGPAAATIEAGRIPFRWGTIDRAALEFLHEVVTALTPGYRRAPVVPFSCLIDAQGQIAVVYRGPVEAGQIVADAALLAMDAAAVRDRITPLRGRWLHPPLPANSMSVAAALREDGRAEFAERYLRHIIEAPAAAGPFALDDAQRGEAAFALGSLLAASGRWRESLAVNEAAIKLAPNDPRPHVNLGSARYRLEEWQAAVAHFSAALELDPRKAHVLVNRGQAHLQLQQIEPALADFEAALDLEPGNDQLRSRCAMIRFQRGEDRQALAHFRSLLQRHPNSPNLEGPVAWILATSSDDALRDGNEALRLATKWCEATNFADPNALNTLAAAQAETGQFEAAVQTVTQAIALANEGGLDALVAPLEERLALYRSGKPFRR